jgi:RNA polymerase sigma-70 factor (ECF subfamily)
MEPQPVITGTDRDLAEAVLYHGDERAFREIYRRHTPRLLGLVHRLLGRAQDDAEDVVQETWIRVCKSLERFRWDSSFSTWLMGIGINVVRDVIRRETRSKTISMEELPDPPGPGVKHEDRIDLERAIKTLPDNYRLVLVLHDVEGMKHREIAHKLNMPEGTSKTQLMKARKLLRNFLSGTRETDHE